MRKHFYCMGVLCLFIYGHSNAQDKVKLPTPNFLNEQLSAQLLNQTKALSDPNLINAQARLFRAYYQALIEAGFNKEEALQIVIAIAARDKN